MKSAVLKGASVAAMAFWVFGLACEEDQEPLGIPDPGESKTGYCSYLPAAVGNEWVFDYYHFENGRETFDEYTLRIVSAVKDCYGFAGYKYELRNPKGHLYVCGFLGFNGDACYVLRYDRGRWEFVLSPDMRLGRYSESGVFCGVAAEFEGFRRVAVPAGEFADCMFFRGSSDAEPANALTYYAKEVGPVYFSFTYTEPWPYGEYEIFSLKTYSLRTPE